MTRFTYKYLKPVALLLAIAVLFQCCKVYYKEPVTIEEAIGYDKKRVKVITMSNMEYVFDSIYYKGNKLYGLVPIQKEELQLLEPHNKRLYLYKQKEK